MIEFDATKTARFFNEVYRQTDGERAKNPDTWLHPRDHILLRHILPAVAPARCRVLDYGCGQGRLLARLLELGFEAEGMEKHGGMRQNAETLTARWSGDRARVLAGGIDLLASLPPESYDLLIAMGVFQYLSKSEYDRTLTEIRRVLKPGATLVATFQNALFDLYTFNKYTVDFMMENFVLRQVEDAAAVARIRDDICGLLVNPDKPPYTETRARDNIFVHLTNPLTIADHLRAAGFAVRQKYFYDFFGLPPLLAARYADTARPIAARFEVVDAAAWQGHFMANAFLLESTRAL